MDAVDGSKSIGDRATELMRAYAQSFAPRSYELWYTYVSGRNAALSEAVKRLIGSQGSLSAEDVEALYAEHLANDRLAEASERSGSGLLVEMERILSMIGSALGSTERYGASLEALRGDLSGPLEPGRMRDVLETLITATREVAESNGALESRLKESQGEIQSLRERLEEVRIETLTDALTGLANRRHFEAVLANRVGQAHNEGSPLTLVMADIDEFKCFNDLHGHLTGDQVLRLVSAAMREVVQDGATLARFGGEEFSIVLPATASAKGLTQAEAIRRSVMARELIKRSTGESLGRVTVSLGVASLRPGDTPISLTERADRCMYRAKRGGRNRTVTDQECGEELSSAA